MLNDTLNRIEGSEAINERFEVGDDLWGINDFFAERNWSDGLPIVLLTEDRVALMVEAAMRDPLVVGVGVGVG
jgi:hypothetical protein